MNWLQNTAQGVGEGRHQFIRGTTADHHQVIEELGADHQIGIIAVDRQLVIEAVHQEITWSMTTAENGIHHPEIIPDEAEADPLHDEDRDRDRRVDVGPFQVRGMFLIAMEDVYQVLDSITSQNQECTGDPTAHRRPERITPVIIALEAEVEIQNEIAITFEAEVGVENEVVVALITISILVTTTWTVMGGMCVVQVPEDLNPSRHNTSPEISAFGITRRTISQLNKGPQAFSVM